MPSCMRAPPETVTPSTGSPCSAAISNVRVIFSPTTVPMEPIMNCASMTNRAAACPPMRPVPQTTPSGRPVALRAAESFFS